MSGYEAAHAAVRRLRGPASEYRCECDRRPALDWAYDHADPSAQRDTAGRVYSLDPARYRPLCRPCHLRFDQSPAYHQTLALILNRPCSTCGAKIGTLCTRSSGQPLTGIHFQHAPRLNAVREQAHPAVAFPA